MVSYKVRLLIVILFLVGPGRTKRHFFFHCHTRNFLSLEMEVGKSFEQYILQF
jgi:hypothetical protein